MRTSSASACDAFPFLLLPAELRLKVYSYVCDHKFMSVPPRGRSASIASFSNALLLAQLNQQIRAESLPHVFSETVLIVDWDVLHHYVYTNFPDSAAQAVTSVRIVGFPVHGETKLHKSPNDFYPWSLIALFPSLKHLRINLRADECISQAMTFGNGCWYWGHDDISVADIMEAPGIRWMRRNKGIQTLTFKIYDLCYDCMTLSAAHLMLEEVSRRVKKEVEVL